MEQTPSHKWQTVDPQVWKPENKGDQIEGILRDKKFDVGKNESSIYVIELNTGVLMSVWGSAVLDTRMALVNVHDYVRITFEGKKDKGKGQSLKLFKVERSLP